MVSMICMEGVGYVLFFKQKTAYEMRISDWSSDVCSSDRAWAPEDGAERWLYTALANVLTGIGFALLIGAAAELKGGIGSWRQGVFWGQIGRASCWESVCQYV